MTKVYWAPCFNKDAPSIVSSVNLLFKEPINLIKHLHESRNKNSYSKCPAFLDFCKNVYIIQAPFDITFSVNAHEKYLTTNLPEFIYREFVNNRGNESDPTDPYILSMPPRYVFYSKESVKMEMLPAFLNNSRSIDNINLIPGTYDIGKWIRPIDFSFELKDHTEVVKIKENDPLFYIKFTTTNDEKIELERVALDQELYSAINTCSSLKLTNKTTYTLKKMYEMAEGYLNVLSFRKKKKCPFHYWK